MSAKSNQPSAFRVVRTEKSFVRDGLFPLGATTVACPHPQRPKHFRWVQLINLFEGSDRGTGVLCRISDDKGNTWRETGVFDRAYRPNADPDEKMMKTQNGCLYDARSGALVRFVTEYLWREGDLQTILGSILRKRRMYYCLSFDGGETWTDGTYIHQSGAGWDRDRMFPGVSYGTNMIMSSQPIIACGEGSHSGDIVLGVQIQMVDGEGELINPTVMGFFQSGCLFGRWREDEGRYDWTIGGGFASAPVTETTRGLYEPGIVECDDGRLLMVLRGSNMHARERMPGTKWICVSADQGETWSAPKRLRYDDGRLMYSSSSSLCLVRDAAGAVYYIGMVNEDNPDGNLPRYPLCVATVDADALAVDSGSVTPIIGKQPEQDEATAVHPVDYSNHAVLWDEAERKLIVFVPYRPDLRKFEGVLVQIEVEARQ